MYSEQNILSTVKQINNILNNEQLSEIKNIINSTHISCENIFSTNHLININLFENDFIKNTIFPIIKTKFHYSGSLENIICKIQSYSDKDKYNVISEYDNYTVFSLDINSNNLLGEDNDNTLSKNDLFNSIIQCNKKEEKNDIRNNQFMNNDTFSFNKNDSLVLPHVNNYLEREFILEKQNILDIFGYLYFIIPQSNSTGFAYEHINNNCIKFPANYIHKSKPYSRFSNSRRVSILFICKNI